MIGDIARFWEQLNENYDEVDDFCVLVQDHILKQEMPVNRSVKDLLRQDHDLLGSEDLEVGEQ